MSVRNTCWKFICSFHNSATFLATSLCHHHHLHSYRNTTINYLLHFAALNLHQTTNSLCISGESWCDTERQTGRFTIAFSVTNKPGGLKSSIQYKTYYSKEMMFRTQFHLPYSHSRC